jgi:hypothetical protein
MVFVEGHDLLALDGTGYFSSNEMHGDSCLETHHRKGTVTYAHQLLGAALIHPDQREVIPLMPEPMVKPDGSEKNACERNAAKRFVSKCRRDHPHLKVMVTEDSLSSNAPHIETLHAHDMRYILGVKEGNQAFCFSKSRRPSKLAVSPTMSVTTSTRASTIAFALSALCPSMHPTPHSASPS